MEKRNDGKQTGLLKKILIGAGIFVCCFALQIILMLALDSKMHYFRLKDTAAPVDATITRVTKYTDSDDSSDEDYRLYVSYTYRGIPYVNVSYRGAEDMAEDGFIGRAVELRVDPEHPGIIFPDPVDAWGACCMVLLLTVLTSFMVMVLISREFSTRYVSKEWMRIYEGPTLTRMQVQEDVDSEMSCTWRYILLGALASLVFLMLAMLTMIGRLNWWIYAQVLLAGYVLSVAVRGLYQLFVARHSEVTELRFVHRVELVRDSDGDVTSWKLEHYGKWSMDRLKFVAISGKQWSSEYPLEDYWIALNSKGKILRVFPADAFSAVSNH